MADILGIQPVRAEASSVTLTTTTLLANAVYTSGWQDSTTGQRFITITAYTGASQNGSFVVQFTEDTTQTPYASSLTYNVAAGGITVSPVIPVPTRYYRIVYTNGSTNQTSFELALTSAQNQEFLFDVNGSLKVALSGNSTTNPVYVNNFANSYYEYTGGTPTVVIQSGPCYLNKFWNTSITTTSSASYVSIYHGSSTTLSSDTLILSATLGASQVIILDLYLPNGLVITSSGTLPGHVMVSYIL